MNDKTFCAIDYNRYGFHRLHININSILYWEGYDEELTITFINGSKKTFERKDNEELFDKFFNKLKQLTEN